MLLLKMKVCLRNFLSVENEKSQLSEVVSPQNFYACEIDIWYAVISSTYTLSGNLMDF